MTRVFDGCDAVVTQTIVNQRLAPVPLEGRAAAARWTDGKLTVWVSTQNAQISRFILAGALGLDPGSIRVITPDVGGGFGAKVGIDRDAIAVAWAARKIGRAVRWTETRSENLVAMTHGRAQEQTITIGGTRDGRILAYRLDVVQDTGCLPADERVPAVPHQADGGGPLRHPAGADRVPGGGDQHHADLRVPRERAGPRRRPRSSGPSTCSRPRSAWTRPRYAART